MPCKVKIRMAVYKGKIKQLKPICNSKIPNPYMTKGIIGNHLNLKTRYCGTKKQVSTMEEVKGLFKRFV